MQISLQPYQEQVGTNPTRSFEAVLAKLFKLTFKKRALSYGAPAGLPFGQPKPAKRLPDIACPTRGQLCHTSWSLHLHRLWKRRGEGKEGSNVGTSAGVPFRYEAGEDRPVPQKTSTARRARLAHEFVPAALWRKHMCGTCSNLTPLLQSVQAAGSLSRLQPRPFGKLYVNFASFQEASLAPDVLV